MGVVPRAGVPGRLRRSGAEALRLLEHAPGGQRGGLPRTHHADGGLVSVSGDARGTGSRVRPNRRTSGNTGSCAASPRSVVRRPRTWPSIPISNATSCSSATTRADGPSGEAEEGRALAKVASPYVARCHGIERIDGEAFLVVEYVPGRNLAEVRRDGPLGIETVVRILAQLAEGVAAVHARGLIHRDIKPANVILHDDGTPRLVDFGLAAHLGSGRLREPERLAALHGPGTGPGRVGPHRLSAPTSSASGACSTSS